MNSYPMKKYLNTAVILFLSLMSTVEQFVLNMLNLAAGSR